MKKRRKLQQRILAWLICLVMITTMIPTTLMAAASELTTTEQTESEAQAVEDAKAQEEAKAKAKAEAEAKAQAEAKAKAEADAKAQAEAKAKTQANAEANTNEMPQATPREGETYAFTITQKDTQLLIGTSYSFLDEAELTATPELSEEDAGKYRVALDSIIPPIAGGTYPDTTGATAFTPMYADEGKVYGGNYRVEMLSDDGNSWATVIGTETQLRFTVVEPDYVLTIDGVINTNVQVGTTYTFLQDNMKVESNPGTSEEADFRLKVTGVTTPSGGSYIFDSTHTGFTPTNADIDKVYTITYGVEKTKDGGANWELLTDPTATANIQVVGNVINEGEVTGDDARISQLTAEITDGTATFDGNDDPGNDSAPNNKIVRTFDGLTYNLSFTTETKGGSLYKHGRIYFEMELPYTKDQATFDTGAMGLMDNHADYMWTLSEEDEKQILRCYYEVSERTDENGNVIQPIPNTGTFPVYVNVYSMKNGDVIQPTFRASVAYTDGEEKKTSGTYDVPKELVADPVKVSAAPSYNVQLKKVNNAYVGAIGFFDFSTGNDLALNKGAGIVYGGLQGYGITLQLYNPADKGLKGIELPDPTKEITFTVDVSAIYKGEKTGTDFGAVDTPLVWSYGPNSTSEQYDGRNVSDYGYGYAAYQAPDNGTYTGEYISSPKTGRPDCWNGGNWEASQSGSRISFTVSGFTINPFWFPNANLEESYAAATYFDPATGVENIGCFSAGELFLVVPFGGNSGITDANYYPNRFNENGSVQTVAADANFHATSLTGQVAYNEDQANTADDRIAATVTLKRSGNWDNYVYYSNFQPANPGAGVDNVYGGVDYYQGTDTASVGSKLSISWGGRNDPDGDPANSVRAANLLMKFDDEALEVDTSKKPEIAHSWVNEVSYLYAAKPDGSGWTDDTEMKAYNEEKLLYYATVEDLEADGKICVGILAELRDGKDEYRVTWPRVRAYFKAKMDMSIVEKVYQTVSVSNVWRDAEYQAVLAANNGVFPSRLDMAVEDVVQTDEATTPSVHDHKYMSYEKATYDESGFHAGSGGEPYNGDSLYIVPYTTNIKKRVEQKDNAGSDKFNFDLGSGQTVADYVITPSFVFPEGVDISTDFNTIVTIVDNLPAGLSYQSGSAVLGGTYEPNSNNGRPGTVTGGEALEPDIAMNADGSQTLTWTLENRNIEEELPQIHYKADIDQTTPANTSYENNVSIQTTEDKRVIKSENGNYATAVIQINAPAMLVAKKTADKLFNDPDQPMGFTMQWTNTAVNPYNDVVFMDAMPFNGDSKGSAFSGTYTVTGDLDLTFPNAKTAADYTFYYTTDEAAHETISSDYPYAEFTGGDCTVNGVNWIKADITQDRSTSNKGTVSAMDGVTPTAWVILGSLASRESLQAHLNMTPTGNQPEDKYTNQISVNNVTTTTTTYTVLRQLSGIVWLDANYDGRRDSTETRLGGVKVDLMMQDNIGNWVQATDINGNLCASVTTDNVGTYLFTNLPDGEFKVVFSSADRNLGEYRATTVQQAGVSSTSNSDATPSYTGANGVLETGEITGIIMPTAAAMTSSPYAVRYQDFGLVLPAIPEKVYNEKKTDLKDGDTVAVGDTIPYKITYGNDDTIEACDVTITDVIDPGLDVIEASISDGGTYDSATRTITWVLRGVAPKTFDGFVTFDAKVNSEALTEMQVVNNANVTYDYKNVPDASYYVGPLKNPLIKKAYTTDTPSGANQSQVGVDDVIGYEIFWNNTEETKAVVKVTDVLDKGLTLDESSLDATATFTPDDTGVTGGTIVWTFEAEAGIKGSVTFKAKVNESALEKNLVENDAKVKIGNHPETTTDPLKNPVPEKEYDDSTQAGADGTDIAVDDNITYKISYQNLQLDDDGNGVASDVVITDVLDKGLTLDETSLDATAVFTADDTGATGGTIVWTIPAVAYEGSGSVTFTAKVNENAVYKVVNDATVKVGNSSDVTTNKLVNPIGKKDYNNDPAADKQYEINTPVKVGEDVPYKIQFENTKKKSAKITLRDTFSKGLDYNGDAVFTAVKEDGSGLSLTMTEKSRVENEDGSVTVTWEIKDVPSGAQGLLTYSAKVNKDAEVGQLVENNATMQFNNDPERHIGTLRNPVPVKESGILCTGSSKNDGAPVQVGMEIPYTITYANGDKKAIQIIITDTMSKGLEYVAGSAKLDGIAQEPDSITTDPTTGETVLVWTLADVAPGAIGQLSYTAKVNADAENIVENNATIDFDNKNTVDLIPVKNPVPHKDYKEEGYGAGNVVVEIGKSIDYEVTFDHVLEDPAKVVITDTMSKGLTYTKGNAVLDGNVKPDSETVTQNSDGSTTIVWTFDAVAEGSHVVSYQGKVTADAVEIVDNTARISYNNGTDLQLEYLPNPVPQKEYADDTNENDVLVDGQEVTYRINYTNKTDKAQTVTITDTMKVVAGSGTFTYVTESAVLADGTQLEPSTITDNADGGQTVTWELGEIQPGQDGTITYKAKVTGLAAFANEATLVEGENEVKMNPLPNTTADKEYADEKDDGVTKQVGDTIGYEINFFNADTKNIKVVIKDTMSKGLSYKAGTAKLDGKAIGASNESITKNSDGSTTITWIFASATPGAHTITYEGTITSDAVSATEVINTATIAVNDGPEVKLNELKNPVKGPEKTPAKKTTTGTNKKKLVKTGDETNVAHYLLLLAAAMAMMAYAVLQKKRVRR